MISFFPMPYSDELLYSIIARYHVRSGNTSPKITLRELFNSATVSAVLDLPCCIDELVANMPSFIHLSAEELIMKHTLFPYYAAFLPKGRVKEVLTSMKSNFGGDIHTRIGIMASTIQPPKYIRFCPECNKEDKTQFGEYYWHRQHQAPGMLVCSKHFVPLLDSLINVHGINKHAFIPADEKNCSLKQMQKENNERLNTLAQDIRWIFENYEHVKETKDFREKYLDTLKDHGLATSTERIYQVELLKSFTDYYSNKLLELLQLDVDPDNQDNWVSCIVRKHRKAFHPLRHLLMMQFLSGSAEQFYSMPHEYKPFGDGPWICLNASAEHYREPVIEKVEITHCMDTKLPVGTFKCSCGFIYSRRGPDISIEDRFKIGRIKTFGTIWEKKLQEYVEQEQLSMRETARRLNVDPNTVKKYALILQLNHSWSLNSNELSCVNSKDAVNSLKTDLFEVKRTKYRSQWLETKANNLGMTMTDLRAISEKIYMWLYKNDKDWLKSNAPKYNSTQNKSYRVDWNDRDEQLFIHVRKIINEIMQNDTKPTRVTISRVGKETGCLAILEKHLEKLPITKTYLLDNIESIEDFQKRRVIWAAKELKKKDDNISRWEIIRKAGLNVNNSAQIEDYIDSILEKQDNLQLSYWKEKN